MLKYSMEVEGVLFNGTYVRESGETYYSPIFTLCTIMVYDVDLMLVIDPSVIEEIEQELLDDWRWYA